jgi:IclR family transcriptional regulator, acetate operon repressor
MAMKRKPEDSTVGGVQAIERALILLEQLATVRTWIGISELSQSTGQPVGTVHRLLMTLMARGYVIRDERTRRYTLGPACHLLSTRAQSVPDWKSLATPHLQQLAEISGETANLALLDGYYGVYTAQAQSMRLMRLVAEIGNQLPLHATGCGKILLAFQPEHIFAFVVEQIGLPAFTSTTITDTERLRLELTQIRLRGYAIDNEEQEDGVCCLAVPVFGTDEQVQAAISISGPSSRLHEQQMLHLVPQLKRISSAITDDLTNAQNTLLQK